MHEARNYSSKAAIRATNSIRDLVVEGVRTGGDEPLLDAVSGVDLLSRRRRQRRRMEGGGPGGAVVAAAAEVEERRLGEANPCGRGEEECSGEESGEGIGERGELHGELRDGIPLSRDLGKRNGNWGERREGGGVKREEQKRAFNLMHEPQRINVHGVVFLSVTIYRDHKRR